MRTKVSIVILLTGLLFIKLGAFHVYGHENYDTQIETCGFCDLALENQQLEFSPDVSIPKIPTLPAEFFDTQIKPRQASALSIHLTSFLFTRPPPQASA